MTTPPDAKPSPPDRIRVGVIGHVSRDKSSLIAALSLINRHANTGKQAKTRIDQLEARRSNRRGRRP